MKSFDKVLNNAANAVITLAVFVAMCGGVVTVVEYAHIILRTIK